ncbi:MAG: nuclear transport factor 2 family protein [Pseudomonadota bacterium]
MSLAGTTGTVGLVLSLVAASAATAQPTAEEIRESYRAHAALAQFHRWFQVYERPEGGLDNALDLLADDVTITSPLGTAEGVAAYEAAVAALPSTWRNAHFVRSVRAEMGEDVTLTAEVTYLNLGATEDGTLRALTMAYDATFADGGEALPKVDTMAIAPVGPSEETAYRDAYLENRARATVHAYLAFLENPERTLAPFEEILTDAFSINFSSGAITTLDGFAAWLAGPASSVSASQHRISEFSVQGTDTAFSVEMAFDWSGLAPDGTQLEARTRHRWRLVNDVAERFARIKTVDVEVLVPFRPVVVE